MTDQKEATTTAGLQAKVELRKAWFEAHPDQPVPEARAAVEALFQAIEDDWDHRLPRFPKPMPNPTDFPERVVVGRNGAYWRDYGDDGYSMCPVSDDNDPIEVVATFVRVKPVRVVRVKAAIAEQEAQP